LAVKIRLKKMGSKKRPFFRLIAADSRSPRDGRFIESLGYYNPMTDPPEIQIDDDKVYRWLDQGAKPTGNAVNILRRKGILERWRLLKQGIAIAELDATIEQRRAKQPKPIPKTTKKLSKKAAAKAREEAGGEAGEEAVRGEPVAGEGAEETGAEKADE
jgi:small subunit ribosomal protein S16